MNALKVGIPFPCQLLDKNDNLPLTEMHRELLVDDLVKRLSKVGG